MDPTIKALVKNGMGGGGGDVTSQDLSNAIGTLQTEIATAITTIQENTIDTVVTGLSQLQNQNTINMTTMGETFTKPLDVHALIRGNGLFRGIMNVITNETMSNSHWQNFVLFPAGVTNTTLTVVRPSAALAEDTNRWVDVGFTGEQPPTGCWTLLINPNNPATDIQVLFTETGVTVHGINASGVYESINQNGGFSIPQGRTVFLMIRNVNSYYFCFW